jgi:hypothetical protein
MRRTAKTVEAISISIVDTSFDAQGRILDRSNVADIRVHLQALCLLTPVILLDYVRLHM